MDRVKCFICAQTIANLPEKSIKLMVTQAPFLEPVLDFFMKGIIFPLIRPAHDVIEQQRVTRDLVYAC